MVRVLELFAGIGACSKALSNLGIEHEIVDAVEIDKFAIKSFNAIHGTDFEPQNITKWDKQWYCTNCHRLIANSEIDTYEQDDSVDFVHKACGDLAIDACGNVDLLMHGSPCFVAGTPVLSNTGYCNIEDIKVGDKVLSHDGKFHEVLNIGGKANQKVFSVKAKGNLPLLATANHPFYTIRRTESQTSKKEYVFSEPQWTQVEDLTRNDFVAVDIPQNETNPLNITKEECWLLGRYVADGHIRHSKRLHRKNSYQYGVVFSIGSKKILEFERHLSSYHATVYPHTRSCYRAVINSQKLVEIIEKIGLGTSALTKNVPKVILDLPCDLAESFLDGYMSGDDSYSERTQQYSITTVSRDLALSFQRLVSKVYKVGANISCTRMPSTCVIEGRVCNQHDQYSVHFWKERRKNSRWFIADGKIWYKIYKVEEVGVQDVFNLEVDKSNSYTANNLLVHNCQDFSVAGRQAGGDEGSGTRSSLMYETLRIVEKLKPKCVIWENVKNLLSKKHRPNFDAYQEKMKELGYTNYYQVLNAKDYGIPQNRERVFTVSILNGRCDYEFPQPILLEKRLGDMLESKVDEKYVLSEQMISGMKATNYASYSYDKLHLEITSIAHTIKARFDGNPQCVDVANSFSGSYGRDFGSKGKVEDKTGIAHTLQAAMGSGGGNIPLVISEASPVKRRRTEYGKQMRSLYDNHEIGFSKEMRESYIDDSGIMPTLTVSRREQVITQPVGATIRGRKASKNESYKQTIEINQCGARVSNSRVRKLTPKECWRLMGFDDVDFEKAQKVNSNTQLYKQAGNSIVVNVIEAILYNLLGNGEKNEGK